MHKFRRCIFAGISMRNESVYCPGAPLRMTARNQTRKHWSRDIFREWFITNMAAFHASSLHAPSSLVCNATESDNSSEDELTFDENIPLAGYEEQEEEEDEETIGGFLARNKKSSNTKKKLPTITFALRSKGKGFFAVFLIFAFSSFVRVLQVAIYARVYNAAPFSSPLTAALTTVRTLY